MRARWGSGLLPGSGLLLAAALWGCAGGMSGAPPAAPSAAPAPHIDALLAEPPFDHVHWGVLAVEVETGRVLYERNADRLFIPASNMKIPVAAAALGLLGPGYRWETTFYTHARPVDGVVPGDLYLHGEGDPTLGAPFFDPPGEALSAVSDSLRAAGVRAVEGRLVLDASTWDSTTVPESWMMEDLNGRYGATGGAFSVRSGELEIEVRGGASPGEPATVEWLPRGVSLPRGASADAGDGVPDVAGAPATDPDEPEPAGGEILDERPFVVHDVATVAASADGDDASRFRLEYRPESRHWLLTGEIAVGEVERFTRSGRDPVRLALSALHRALEDRGIEVRGGTGILWERGVPVGSSCASGRVPRCAEMLRIAGMASPPLSEVVPAILGPSQNWMTEQLVRTVGAERGESGSWDEGFRVMLDHLEGEVGIPAGSVYFEDGSGLSAQNLVSPRALVRILERALQEPWGEIFRGGMARPGVEDTTLESRLGSLVGRVHAKTGTISHVNSLSGYLTREEGGPVIFSVLSNGANLPAATVRDRIDAVVEVLAGEAGSLSPGALRPGSLPPGSR